MLPICGNDYFFARLGKIKTLRRKSKGTAVYTLLSERGRLNLRSTDVPVKLLQPPSV